ncbi:MAG: hypothetical protein IJU45_09005 [Clostridia bacterium]|nr:hypothetical protein [Clostridia bacterium]
MRSAFNKLKPYFGKENMLGIYAVLLALHFLYYTVTSFTQFYPIRAYESGMGLITDIYLNVDDIYFKIIRIINYGGVLTALFLLFRKVIADLKKNDGDFSAAELLCCLISIFPAFTACRVFSNSYSSSVHFFIMILTLICVLLMFDGKKRTSVMIICAVCEFLYAGFIFTYFPAILLIYVYGKTSEKSSAKPKGKKAKQIKKDHFTVYLIIVVVLILALLLVLTPALNKGIRHLSAPMSDENDQIIFFDSIDNARRGEWNQDITLKFINYIAAVLPFFTLFSYVWIKAAKSDSSRSRFYLMCLLAELPAAAGVIFFRTVGLWMAGAALGQTLLMLTMVIKRDKAVSEILQGLYIKIKQKNSSVFLLLLLMFALACFFYEMEVFGIFGRNSV